MIESRCGLRCGQCEYHDSVPCPGCTQIAKPFWGENCPVKACCEERGHVHCGECGEFSCALLHQFAYDEKQGDNGARIEQCKRWRREAAPNG